VLLHRYEVWFLRISLSHSEHMYVCLFVVFCFVVFRVCFVCECVCVCVFFGGPGFSSTSPARVMRAAIHVRESRGWPSQKTREMGSLCTREQVYCCHLCRRPMFCRLATLPQLERGNIGSSRCGHGGCQSAQDSSST